MELSFQTGAFLSDGHQAPKCWRSLIKIYWSVQLYEQFYWCISKKMNVFIQTEMRDESLYRGLC